MELMDRNKITVNLNRIVNKKLSYFRRSLDLVCIGFGDLTLEYDRHNNKCFVGEYALHIQCPFRVIKNDEIVLNSNDIYLSPEQDGIANLDDQNSCLFDFNAKALELDNEVVTGVCLNDNNDLFVFTQNYLIQVFVISNECEAWRFFEIKSDEPHIIVDEDGLSFD